MADSNLIRVPGPLGPYHLIRRIGHGGTGQVFEAEAYGASGFRKRIAIKTLLPSLLGDGELERLFIREALLAAPLAHPNLVGVHDFGVDRGIQYMRLDFVDGPNLADYRGAGPLARNEALQIMSKVAAGLQYIHEFRADSQAKLGLVYRDLKPSNILVARSGQVKLTDFGIAKASALADVTRGGVRRGTQCYMSPEQIRGGELTAASDRFAFGTVLAELLLGHNPFEAETPLDTLDRITSVAPAGIDSLDADLVTFLHRCFAADPADRFGSTAELRAALPLA